MLAQTGLAAQKNDKCPSSSRCWHRPDWPHTNNYKCPSSSRCLHRLNWPHTKISVLVARVAGTDCTRCTQENNKCPISPRCWHRLDWPNKRTVSVLVAGLAEQKIMIRILVARVAGTASFDIGHESYMLIIICRPRNRVKEAAADRKACGCDT